MVQELAFKDIPYMQFLQPFCTAERHHLCKIGEPMRTFSICVIILNMDKWFRRCCLKVFLIYSTGSNLVWRSRIYDCEIILNSD